MKSPGHVAGLVGEFRVKEATKRVVEDEFDELLTGFERALQTTGGTELEAPLLSPEEWIENPYNAGPFAGSFLWPEKKRVFCKAARGDNIVNVFTGAIGTGKTQLIVLIALYDLYRMCNFVSPHAFLGFPATSELVTVLIHQNQTKAKDKILDPLRAAVDLTPYFKRECPRDKRLESSIFFPRKNVKARVGVTGEAAIHGEDVFALHCSEANFYSVVADSVRKRGGEVLDVAQDLHDSMLVRWESRFLRGGKLQLCRMSLDSSRQYPDDFVERVEKRILRGDYPYPAQVFSMSQWDAKRGVLDNMGKPLYSGRVFPVEVATGNRVSRILDADEVEHAIGQVVWCAEEHRASFEGDIDKALRDLAGVAVQGLHPLIPQREAISACFRLEPAFQQHQVMHPFTATTTTLRDSVAMILDFLCDSKTRQPRVNPDKLRTVHVDPAFTSDALGLCMAHVDEVVTVNRMTEGQLDIPCLVCCIGDNPTPGVVRCPRCVGSGLRKHYGRTVACVECRGAKVIKCPSCKGSMKHGTPTQRPRVYADLTLQVTPPKSGRIQFDDVEALLARLRAGGFRIAVVTADGHQSEQFLQRQLNETGVYIAEKLSMDTSKDPYYALRDSILDLDSEGRRRLSLYDYPPLFDELCRVEDRRDKIDHPRNGSKDVADALAGVVYNCEVHGFLRESVISGNLQVKGFDGKVR